MENRNDNLRICLMNQQKNNFYLKKILKIIKFYKNDKVFVLKKNVNLNFFKEKKINFLISFHNGFIIKKKIIKYLNYNCINFHASLLPQNRGASPILWTAIKSQSFGVTIHKINEKIDDGKYLFQKKITNIKKNFTLKKIYKIHEYTYLNGFKKIYKKIRKDIINKGSIKINLKNKNNCKGSFNYIKETNEIINLLPKKYNTKIFELKEILNIKK